MLSHFFTPETLLAPKLPLSDAELITWLEEHTQLRYQGKALNLRMLDREMQTPILGFVKCLENRTIATPRTIMKISRPTDRLIPITPSAPVLSFEPRIKSLSQTKISLFSSFFPRLFGNASSYGSQSS